MVPSLLSISNREGMNSTFGEAAELALLARRRPDMVVRGEGGGAQLDTWVVGATTN